MAPHVLIEPNDNSNRKLKDNAHPPDWVNPEPAPRYNLVVLGGGTAGLVSAAGAAGLGAEVALIEREWLGGDCLVTGCVLSKALIRAARACADVRNAGSFQVGVPTGARVNFPGMMERMRRLRAELSGNDSAERFRRLGVDVFLGEGRFTGPDRLEVGGRSLQFRKAVIATGSRPAIPSIPGLVEARFLTNETVFNLTELPRRLAVIGAGPIGCELAQAFARFGSEVTVIGKQPQLLAREDRDAATILEKSFYRDDVKLFLGADAQRVELANGEKILKLDGDRDVRFDAILVGTGRAPNVEGIGLEAAGVDYETRAGVKVNDHLRTSNRRIFAAGDVCTRYQFTHAADAMARIALRNALFLGRSWMSALTMPWGTYTDPEIAHVGLSEKGARECGFDVLTLVQPLDRVDRAVLDGESEGFVKVHLRQGSDRILGATIVAAHAGEMLSELTLAMVGGLGMGTLANTIHPYPTQVEARKKSPTHTTARGRHLSLSDYLSGGLLGRVDVRRVFTLPIPAGQFNRRPAVQPTFFAKIVADDLPSHQGAAQSNGHGSFRVLMRTARDQEGNPCPRRLRARPPPSPKPSRNTSPSSLPMLTYPNSRGRPSWSGPFSVLSLGHRRSTWCCERD
jgi:pyruvate/2-oxoglutarate dehydrogenase complex dihydrolipoamide dehydrogenase (E3) component